MPTDYKARLDELEKIADTDDLIDGLAHDLCIDLLVTARELLAERDGLRATVDAAHELAERMISECEHTLDYGEKSKLIVSLGHQFKELLVKTEQGL